MSSEHRTPSGRLLYVDPDIEWYQVGDWERGYHFTPAFRDDVGMAGGNPSDNYGRGSVRFAAYLRKDGRAVQFKLTTGWDVEDVEVDWDARRSRRYRSAFGRPPSGMDLGYHSPTQRYDDQDPMSDTCEILDGLCYYDGSGLAADDVLRRLVLEGMDGVWAALEAYYAGTFAEVAA